MTDVRLTATNPDDSSVVPVACNSRGELLVAEPVIEEIPNDVDFTGDVSITGALTVGGNSSFQDSIFDGAATFSSDVVINAITVGRGSGTGAGNTAVGGSALQANTLGANNTAIGGFTLQKNTEGTKNTAIGVSALKENTLGANNTAVGGSALQANTLGANNTAIGVDALQKNTEGTHNTALGPGALYENTTGTKNTALGPGALYQSATGTKNTAIGWDALRSVLSGQSNIAIGHNNGRLLTGSSNTFIGSHQGAIGLSNTLSLSTGPTERMRISQDDTVDFNQKCGFTADGGLWITDERGNKMRTTFASNGLMAWTAYEVQARNEPQLSDEQIEEMRTRNGYGD